MTISRDCLYGVCGRSGEKMILCVRILMIRVSQRRVERCGEWRVEESEERRQKGMYLLPVLLATATSTRTATATNSRRLLLRSREE